MKITDFIPHRFILQHSLGRASDDLRTCIEQRQEEYARKAKEYAAEIERERTIRDIEFEDVKNKLLQELMKDQEFFRSIEKDLSAYIDGWFQLQYLYKVKELKGMEFEAANEEVDFLSGQMELIEDEISRLEERRDLLASQVEIEDIIKLIQLSDTDIEIIPGSDAFTLLSQVSKLISQCENSDDPKKYALLRLKAMLRERTEFLSEIQYISWVIGRKRSLGSHCEWKYKETWRHRTKCLKELREVKGTCWDLKEKNVKMAEKVRQNWEIPMAQIRAEYESVKREKAAVWEVINGINGRIRELYHNEENELEERRVLEKRAQKKQQIKEFEEGYSALIAVAGQDVSRAEGEAVRCRTMLEICRQNDYRPLFARMFTETDEVRNARRRLEQAEDNLKKKKEELKKLQMEKERQIYYMKVELNKLQPIIRRPTPDEYKELQNLKEQRHMLFEDGTLAALDKRLNELSKESNRWDKRKRMVFSLCKRNGLYLFGRQYQGGKK